MQSYTIKAKHFLAGESLNEWDDNGGFSPESIGLNLLYKRGNLYFAPTPTDRGGATLTGNIIASCFDPASLGNDAYHLDDEGAFYTLNGPTLTKRQTSTADTFTLGTTEMMPFQGAILATSQTRVMLLGNNFATIDSSWWTGLTSACRHPIERVEDKAYIGNLNVIEIYDGTNTSGTGAGNITLPTNVNITSLRRHPDGKNLIAFAGQTIDFSHTRPNAGYIYLVDTNLKTWTREIAIEAQVEGSRLVGGVVFVTYGNKVGYFTGSGIKFLKKLETSTTTYSHNISNIEDIFLVRDGLNIKAYGDLGRGKIWWNLIKNQTNAQNINNIQYKGSSIVLMAFSDGAGAGYLQELDLTTVGQFGNLYSNKYEFGKRVMIRKIVILHTTTNAAGVSRFLIQAPNQDDNTSNILVDKTYTNQAVYRTIVECQHECEVLQLYMFLSNDVLGFKYIRFYYEPIEE